MKNVIFIIILLIIPIKGNSQEENSVFLSLTRTNSLKNSNLDINTYTKNELEEGKINDLSKLLEEISEINIRKAGGNMALSLPSIRGFSAKQNVILIDDIKLPKDLTGTNDLSLLPIYNMYKVEVLKGGYSALYGSNSEGGVISIVTDKVNKNSQIAKMSADYSSFDTKIYKLQNGFNKDNLEVLTSLQNYHTGGFQENSKSDMNHLGINISYDFQDYGKIIARGFAVKSKRGIPSGTPIDISLWDGEKEKKANTLNDFQKDDNIWLNFEYKIKLKEEEISVNYGRSIFNTFAHQYNSWTGLFDDTDIKNVGNIFSLKSKIKGYNLGIELEKNNLYSNTYSNHELKNIGYYINKNFVISSKLNFLSFLRYDDNKQYDNVLSPKAVVNYKLNEKFIFALSSNLSWQSPTFADLYNPWAPNPNLKPEKSIQNEVSIEYKNNYSFYVKTSLYYADIKDRIALDPYSSWAAYNIDKAFNKGLEVSSGIEFFDFKFKSSINILSAKGKTKNEGTYKFLAYIPEYKFNSSLSHNSKLFYSKITSQYVSSVYTGKDRTGKKIPAYNFYDFLISKKINNLEIYFAVDNIFNKHYAMTADSFNGYYPANPRIYRTGLSLVF